jgi:hypothetical protein
MGSTRTRSGPSQVTGDGAAPCRPNRQGNRHPPSTARPTGWNSGGSLTDVDQGTSRGMGARGPGRHGEAPTISTVPRRHGTVCHCDRRSEGVRMVRAPDPRVERAVEILRPVVSTTGEAGKAGLTSAASGYEPRASRLRARAFSYSSPVIRTTPIRNPTAAFDWTSWFDAVGSIRCTTSPLAQRGPIPRHETATPHSANRRDRPRPPRVSNDGPLSRARRGR